ncbi:transcription termination factor Rho [Gordonia sp. HY442]|uniref:transcription termination factor Rho n=1 Tax=Gordonia zhenghanii TaxID=2911516 RepID=UPI001F00422C|nr:transcription termination factor Rho [Gordonia zhenghanii]MCF8605049.1 transcription termination factor Rho [Gordonia zhenghanii]
MLLPELRALAGGLGIKGTSGMRKGDLIDVIRAHQQGGGPQSAPAAKRKAAPAKDAGDARADTANAPEQNSSPTEAPVVKGAPQNPEAQNTEPQNTAPQADAPKTRDAHAGDKSAADNGGDQQRANRDRNRNRNRGDRDRGPNAGGQNPGGQNPNSDNGGHENANKQNHGEAKQADRPEKNNGDKNNGEKNNGDKSQGDRNQRQGNQNRGGQNQGNQNQGGQNPNQGGRNNQNNNDDDDMDGNGRRRGRRFRERRRGRDRGPDGGGEPQVNEGDTIVPVAGILDVLDNYAFVRTSGYLAGSNDVYVSMNLVRRNGLRRGDAITGAVKVPREGESPSGQGNQRQKFNPLVRLDTVNGSDVEAARKRPDFNKLTPLYPNQRLRLETTPDRLSTRVIDLIMPIGKGQRALIVSPPKAGKTTILQDIANAISTNNPECHLMVVLVDERPEEVTDMQRSVKGEVIASTFDRPPSDHTSVAELAIERAKRLVESGQDVVVLLDSITRLGRAYNNASPASGRILSGGVDSTALYPPKRFLGAARNIENGGSLTIIASALVETGSTGDTVIFEEFKGTGNAELKLDRKISERRVFPAVDLNLSSTRKDELLLSPDEFAIVHKLRRLLSGLDSQAAIDLLISQLKKSGSNVEFLMQVSKNAPAVMKEN